MRTVKIVILQSERISKKDVYVRVDVSWIVAPHGISLDILRTVERVLLVEVDYRSHGVRRDRAKTRLFPQRIEGSNLASVKRAVPVVQTGDVAVEVFVGGVASIPTASQPVMLSHRASRGKRPV